MKKELPPSYQIVRTEEFINKAHDLGKTYTRVRELIKAIDWALSRNPHNFSNIANDYYLFKTQELANPEFPKLNILYKIIEDQNTVILLGIDD